MKNIQIERIKSGKGFIAALDQSGGSTPKTLLRYGVPQEAYTCDEEMFQLVHDMRSRIMKSPAFNKDKILGAILFEKTMDLKVDGQYTGDFLWETKGIVPILKVDKGLLDLENGVQLMKPLNNLDELLVRAKERNIFSTKMRSLIKEENELGIKDIVDQQFEIAKMILAAGLIPIIEPEVDINMVNKKEAEILLKKELLKALKTLDGNQKIIFKLTIPEVNNFYEDLLQDENVLRVAALSGGYSREEANEKLSKNNKLIASFSRALTEGLNIDQYEEVFNNKLSQSIDSIYEASVSPI